MLFTWTSSSLWSHSPDLSQVRHRDQRDHVLGFWPMNNARKHSPCCEDREAMGKKGKEGSSEAVDSLFDLGPSASDQKPQNAWKLCPSFLVSKQEKKNVELGPAPVSLVPLPSTHSRPGAMWHQKYSALLQISSLTMVSLLLPDYIKKSCFSLVLGFILGVIFYVYILPHFILTNTLST